MSRSTLRRIATSEAGRTGGFHGVRVLDFTPPAEEPPEERTTPAGYRGPLVFGMWRRAHWKPGVRIGIRDSEGRLVGPVYMDGAVEGLTFTRERRFFPRARIRPDLPLAPTTSVYRISNPGASGRWPSHEGESRSSRGTVEGTGCRGREAEPLARWLVDHPEVEIVCRDRATAHAEAAKQAAPQTVQVADVWHLWSNLAKAVEKPVAAHYSCLRSAHESAAAANEPEPPPVPDGFLDVHGRPRSIVATIRERHRAVQELRAAGRSLRGISRDLDLDYYSVRRYARTANVDEMLVKVTQRRTKLDGYKPYIYRRFTEGCHNARQLFREVREQGFPGERTTVSRYVRLLREGMVTAPPLPALPKPRRALRWIMTHPERLRPDEAVGIKEIRAACPELDATVDHVRTFAGLMHEHHGEDLPAWIAYRAPGALAKWKARSRESSSSSAPGTAEPNSTSSAPGSSYGTDRPESQDQRHSPLRGTGWCGRL
ncbi:hypothetical protein [Streptomyces sp. NPDC002078]